MDYTSTSGADIMFANRDKMNNSALAVDEYAPPDNYNAYANTFDLSLLPIDNVLLDSALTEAVSNVTAASDQQSSVDAVPIDYIPTTVYQHFPIKSEHSSAPIPVIRTYPPLTTASGDTTAFFQQQCHASQNSVSEHMLSIFPPSPTPSHDSTYTIGSRAGIKQEFGSGSSLLFPPSPADSYGSLSPRCYTSGDYVKSEPQYGSPAFASSSASSVSSLSSSETCLDIDSLLDAVSGIDCDLDSPPHSTHQQQQDHQLLREFLQDTTFQRKHNLKPLALDALLMGGWDNGDDFGPVLSLALEHARKDVQRTCDVLRISADPQDWTVGQVQQWLHSTISQFAMEPVAELDRLFPENGAELSRLSDEMFVKRLPQNGGTLHAQLEVWKAACCESICPPAFEQQIDMDIITSEAPISTETAKAPNNGTADTFNVIADEAHPIQPALMHPWSSTDKSQKTSIAAEDFSDDDDEDMMPVESGISSALPESDNIIANGIALSSGTTAQAKSATKTGRQGGAHIHLWQFLKELLADAQLHGTSIRWLDRTKGVFKIEDSVRVARLWGRRKNRPAMNYDKLSRSIRQYYKKGIMKKTERSQRLVYQFCHPYSL